MPQPRKMAIGAVVAAIAIATGSLALLAARDREPAREAKLPDTPAGDQVAWLLEQMNGPTLSAESASSGERQAHPRDERPHP